jgi:hypothetical protein
MATAAASGNGVAVEDGDDSRGPGRPNGSGAPSSRFHEEADSMSEGEAHLELGSASDSPGLDDSIDVDQLTLDAEALLSVCYNCCLTYGMLTVVLCTVWLMPTKQEQALRIFVW